MLFTSSLDPIISSSFVVMGRPKPVPSIVRVLFSSRRSNELKSLGRSSSLMPIPVSITCTNKVTLSSSLELTEISSVTEPLSVYLTALVSRLIMTWLILRSSP